ncbi:MAG: glutamine--fructose-6-phosphate transaminase (isomerizing) [Rhodospirillaceae bacterium]|nr:glutamine--fructose-6-phosphate transaminase (isomerizing) [Rhodospirillaceae bacterium]
MCGIIGIIGKQAVAQSLVGALKRLEYRGYDSAGIATLVGGLIERRRAEGKLVNLESLIDRHPIEGRTGIGHTRWATHGVPNERNAHPHATRRVAVVHNGIIENFRDLRAELETLGCQLASETDTEVIAHLITHYLEDEKLAPAEACRRTIGRLHGAFALAIIFAGEENLMIGARQGSPLAVGYGDGEMYLGSDAIALAPLSRRVTYLEDGDWVVLTAAGADVRGPDGKPVERPVRLIATSGAAVEKGGFRHFMLKEIHEQPQVVGDVLCALVNPADRSVCLPNLPFDLAAVSRVTLVACGTSYYAAMVAKYWIETLARVPAEVDIASEFRYRAPVMKKGGLAVFISQSGETADTLAALREAKARGQHVLSLVNVLESTIARESDIVLQTYAGPEIGVASTKSFTTQLTVLACFAVALGRARGALDAKTAARHVESLIEVPSKAADFLASDGAIQEIAAEVAAAQDVLYLGRGSNYPIALEGALKLKEISYIHAEGYAAGEMKHGPIALIDERVPVIVVAPTDELFEKTASNVQEVLARGGRIILLSDVDGIARLTVPGIQSVCLPKLDPLVAPILYAIPVQLLAYHVAVLKGTDVDQPRNLAKSVTVE